MHSQHPDVLRKRAARTVRTVSLALLIMAPTTLAAQGAAPDTLHGTVVADPYRHLERLDDPATVAWVQAQDRLARAEFAKDPERARTRAAIRQLFERASVTPPLRRGTMEFYGVRSTAGPGGTSDVWVRPRGSSEPGRILLPGSATRGRGFVPSPDGHLLAYSEGQINSLWSDIRIRDVRTGRDIDLAGVRVHRTQPGLVWAAEGSGFFYQHTPESGRDGEVAPSEVRFRRLDGTREEKVFVPPADAGSSTVRMVLRNGSGVLVVLLTDNTTSHDRIFVADARRPGSAAREVTTRAGSYSYAGELGGSLYFLTTADAPRGAVVRLDRPMDTPVWRTVIGETDEVINTWPGVGATTIGGHIVVAYGSSVATLRPRVFDRDGRMVRELTLPAGAIWSGFSGSASSDTAYFQVSGLIDPGTVYQLDLRSGRSTPLTLGPNATPAPELVRERHQVPAADGAMIPVDLFYRPGTPRDGTAPLVLYGYGFGGWQPAPYFQAAMAQFVLDGGIWAITAPRGDGVHGEAWRWAGAKRNKQVGIDDYLAVSRWLSAQKFTSADRLVANGSSAGGPLVGAAVLQAPEVFGAAILDYPVLDMVRYEQFGFAAQWQSDFGTASDAGDLAVLHRISPYHRAVAGACRPPILVSPGELDPTAPPHHAYKYVAALQGNVPAQCQRAPVYLRVTWGAGHNAGTTVDDQADTFADQLAFLRQVLPTRE
jgi:prolyl oligopeptidase